MNLFINLMLALLGCASMGAAAWFAQPMHSMWLAFHPDQASTVIAWIFFVNGVCGLATLYVKLWRREY